MGGFVLPASKPGRQLAAPPSGRRECSCSVIRAAAGRHRGFSPFQRWQVIWLKKARWTGSINFLDRNLSMASQCTQPQQLTRVIGAFALCAALSCPTSAPAQGATVQPQHMRFDWAREGPANECKQNCREWVSASGTITKETPQQFADFAKGRNLLGSAVVLESGGGNLAAAIWLGREFRRLGMATTVGKTDF